MSSKAKFSSKIGVIAATVGSAVGLGTIWRFPNEVQANGGSAFLIAYLICVILMGIPVMLAEFTIGHGSRSDTVTAFHKLTPGKPWWIIGAMGVAAPYLILMYYMVVAGWTLEYFWMSITGELFSGLNGPGTSATSFFQNIMNDSISSGWKPIFWTSLMIFLNLYILLHGVKKGIERMSNTLMPMLFVILVLFCVVSLTLPGAMKGVEFFLKPDFSKMDSNVLISAVGQAFFSLSLGMGILITYSAYFPKDTKMPRTAGTVSALVFLVAIMTGLIIFPAMQSFGISGDTQGTALIFVTIPQIFLQLPAPQLWAILFFFLLVVAALTSTVSVAEVPIAFLCDKFGFSRKKACCAILLPMLLFCSVCSLSQGPWAGLTLFGLNIFGLLDYFSSNILLPIVAISVCLYVGFVLPKRFFFNEITNHGTMKPRMAKVFFLFIRFIAPLLILTVLVSKLIG